MSLHQKTLLDLADARAEEAITLLNAGLYPGAYYLIGYTVELTLKAIIAGKKFKEKTIPEKNLVQSIHTHNLKALMRVAGLDTLLDEDCRKNSVLFENWSTVQRWTEQSRYQLKTKSESTGLLDAIGDSEHGLYPWLEKFL